LSGNPIAMAAGLATLEIISAANFYEPLFEHTSRLANGLRDAARTAGVPFTTNHAGTMFGGFFTDAPQVSNYQQVMNCNNDLFNQFFHGMLDAGVYLAPASYEAGFMSSAHSDEEIDATLDAAATVMARL
jgi:glutamate-1-semialdehyde 2,1-aminomutase